VDPTVDADGGKDGFLSVEPSPYMHPTDVEVIIYLYICIYTYTYK